MKEFYLPLMAENIDREDVNNLVAFLQQNPIPKLTNGEKVLEFEKAWSEWLGVKYSLFVNSGSSANQLTMLILGEAFAAEKGEIIVPPLTWVSDISAVIQNGFTPVFCDINLKNLSFDLEQLKEKITDKTRAIFLTHVLGINALTDELIQICKDKGILLIEDVCESHGATFKGRKAGSIGQVSNFSFYFAHHMSTIEGGMICTNDERLYQLARCFRSHGMLRESTDSELKQEVIDQWPELNKDFIFLAPAYNFRSTELNAVLGLSQLKKLDANNEQRKKNFIHFMENLDKEKYITRLEMEGQCNYAFIVILKNPSLSSRDLVEKTLTENYIEFRRGLSGGGSQIKQPYIQMRYDIDEADFPVMEHVHHNSWYIGNYPSLPKNKIDNLLRILNSLEV